MESMLTVQQIAEVLNISYDTALEVVKKEMEYIKINRRYRIPQDSFKKYLLKLRRKSANEYGG